jgi:hypothetical protein
MTQLKYYIDALIVTKQRDRCGYGTGLHLKPILVSQ